MYQPPGAANRVDSGMKAGLAAWVQIRNGSSYFPDDEPIYRRLMLFGCFLLPYLPPHIASVAHKACNKIRCNSKPQHLVPLFRPQYSIAHLDAGNRKQEPEHPHNADTRHENQFHNQQQQAGENERSNRNQFNRHALKIQGFRAGCKTVFKAF